MPLHGVKDSFSGKNCNILKRPYGDHMLVTTAGSPRFVCVFVVKTYCSLSLSDCFTY